MALQWEYVCQEFSYADLPTVLDIAGGNYWEAFAALPRDGLTCLVFFKREKQGAPSGFVQTWPTKSGG